MIPFAFIIYNMRKKTNSFFRDTDSLCHHTRIFNMVRFQEDREDAYNSYYNDSIAKQIHLLLKRSCSVHTLVRSGKYFSPVHKQDSIYDVTINGRCDIDVI